MPSSGLRCFNVFHMLLLDKWLYLLNRPGTFFTLFTRRPAKKTNHPNIQNNPQKTGWVYLEAYVRTFSKSGNTEWTTKRRRYINTYIYLCVHRSSHNHKKIHVFLVWLFPIPKTNDNLFILAHHGKCL